MSTNQVEVLGLDCVAVPLDTTGAAIATVYLSMKNYTRVTFLICQGAWAGGTPAVTLEQATDVSGTGAKALSFDKHYTKLAEVASQYTEVAVVSDTFNLGSVADTIVAIDIQGATLDTTNEFDAIQLKIASPGANADLISVIAVLSGAAYPQDPIPDAKID